MAEQPRKESKFITVKQVARDLGCGTTTVYRLIYAANMKLKGVPLDEIPHEIRIYLDAGFPPPARLGMGQYRIRRAAYEEWRDKYLNE